MNLNASPSPFPMEQINDNHDQDHQPFVQNNQVSSSISSSSVSCHIFLSSTQDHSGHYHDQFYQPHFQVDEKHVQREGSSYEIKNKGNSGLKLTLGKKEDHGPRESMLRKNNQVKWMSSKMRLMQRMKNPDRVIIKMKRSSHEDHKQHKSSSLGTDTSSRSSSCNSPIRVCADCNTTKTPLWRSGPKGPKSLCNACGIRQRKARRAAMAAAAAAAAGRGADQPPPLKIKVQHEEEMGHSPQLRKRCKMATAATAAAAASAVSPSNGPKKGVGFEDFLINLSNKLSFHRVFPEDEKDAAILLMALSSGLVHG